MLGTGVALKGFAFAAALTVLVEWLLSLLFFRKRTDRLIVVLAQLVTNPILNLIMFWLYAAYRGAFPFGIFYVLLILEVGVIIVEAAIYLRAMSAGSRRKKVVFSVVANIITTVFGLVLMIL